MFLAWTFFRHYLLSRRAGALIRTVAWLCMVGVAVSVFALVVVVSVMNGFNEAYQRRLLAVEPHLVVRLPTVHDAATLEAHPVTKKVRAVLAEAPVVSAEIFEQQDVIVRTVDGLFGGAIAKGTGPASLRQLLEGLANGRRDATLTPTVETSPSQVESVNLEVGEVMMGIDLARSLGVFEGDTVVMIPPEALLLPAGEVPPYERVLVKRLITTNLADIDGKVVFYHRDESLRSFKNAVSKEAGWEIRFRDASVADAVKERLESIGADAKTWMERNSSLFYALRMEKIAMGTFLGLSALISSFSIVTVLVLMLTQKRKDIGLLMGLGLSTAMTRKLFVQVGLLLSSIGIGTGVVAGIIVCLLVEQYPLSILPDIYYDTTIPAKLEPLFILFILLVAGVIAWVSSYLPARNAVQKSPAEALR